jgi:alkanesulfonate monooxygenase SsuD/methylene tetrahydromethanopterin reductase-like flavin-dependent oxidoreductase (luciferase family)
MKLLRLFWIITRPGANLSSEDDAATAIKQRSGSTNQGAATMTTRLNPLTTPRHQLRAEKARRNKQAALNAFIGKKAEIDERLARLQALSDDHFNCHPDEIGWAAVGSLEYYASLLKRITNSAFGEGEHAECAR